jgi:hypothetical protein
MHAHQELSHKDSQTLTLVQKPGRSLQQGSTEGIHLVAVLARAAVYMCVYVYRREEHYEKVDVKTFLLQEISRQPDGAATGATFT